MTTCNHRPDLVEQLTKGIARLTSSEEWRRYLDCQSRFHDYSFGNVLLIAAQCPYATQVAGFRAWQRMDRFVKKGEKAIWILAPMLYKDADAEEGRVIRGFKYVAVFDVSQTDGEELPEVCHLLFGEDPAGHFDRLVAVANSFGFSVEDAHLPGTTNGDCTHDLHRIRIETTNSPLQRVKTLAHEIAHGILHEHFEDRRLAELEAESTAFVVCQLLGLDTSDYTFGYVAIWAGADEEAVAAIREAGQRIQRAAASIVQRLDVKAEEAVV